MTRLPSPRLPALVALVPLALLLTAGSAGAAPSPAPTTTCVVPEGPALARLTWRDQPVLARSGALVVGGRPLTPCEGLPGPAPQALAVGPDGALWIGFQQAGLYRYDGAGFTAAQGLPAGGVRALATWQGALWAGTGAAGLYRVDGEGQATAHPHRTLGARGITALAVDRDGLQVGVGPYGWWRVRPSGAVARRARGFVAGCFTQAGGRVTPHPPGPACALGDAPPASGLASGHVTALAVHGGGLWVGLFDRGLAHSADGARFTAVADAPRLVNALLSVGDTLWIASPKGLFFARDGRVRRAPIDLPSAHINGLAAGPDGTLWIAHSLGLTGMGPAGVRHLGVAEGLPARIAYAVAVSADGAVWAGTAGGAARISPEGVQVFTEGGGELPHDWINALVPDGADGVLAGTYDAGVVRLTPRGGTPVAGLGAAWVNPGGLFRDGATLWVATLGTGLLQARAGGVSSTAALPSDDVTAWVAWRGAQWIGTRGGLARRDRAGSTARLDASTISVSAADAGSWLPFRLSRPALGL